VEAVEGEGLPSTTDGRFPSSDTLSVLDPANVPEGPEPDSFYRHQTNLLSSLRKLWERKDMVIALAERDIRSSYKQSFLGFGWALISPVLTVLIFTLIFTKVKLFHVAHVPYPLYIFVGLMSWTYFSGSLGAGGGSLIGNMTLLQKTHFPRECFPLSQMLEQMVYTMISLLPLIILFFYYGFAPKPDTVLVPIFILIEILFAAGVTLAMAALVVFVRDFLQVMSLIITMGLYCSPVLWPLSIIPPVWRPYYAAFNPVGPIIDSIRKAMLLGHQPDWRLVGIAAISSLFYFLAGYRIFKRLETGFADRS
jgi:lipopolysaccharide transport system permease protein